MSVGDNPFQGFSAPTIRGPTVLGYGAMRGTAGNDRFLDLLDSNPREAERKYRVLRGKLVFYFQHNGCADPEDPADEVFSRVLRRSTEDVDFGPAPKYRRRRLLFGSERLLLRHRRTHPPGAPPAPQAGGTARRDTGAGASLHPGPQSRRTACARATMPARSPGKRAPDPVALLPWRTAPASPSPSGSRHLHWLQQNGNIVGFAICDHYVPFRIQCEGYRTEIRPKCERRPESSVSIALD